MDKKIMNHNLKLLNSEKGVNLNIHKKSLCKFNVGVGFASKYKYAIHTLGFQYLYLLINGDEDFFAQRFYYPDNSILKIHQNGVPILTQEINTPINKLDILFFTLNYEGNYPKLFEILKISQIPILSCKRNETYPILIAGGICPTYNPLVISNFFDAIVIGEAENVIPLILNSFKKIKEGGNFSKNKLLKELNKIRGIFVPLFPNPVLKSNIGNLENNYLGHIISPYSKFPNYFFLEIARGCNRGCYFCILGNTFQISRKRSIKQILNYAKNMSRYTNKIRLVTPSDSDHPQIIQIYEELKKLGYKIKIGSQRIDSLKKKENMFKFVECSELTIAPETASLRIRKIIGKTISDNDIYDVIKIVSKYTFKTLQLFFIIGFPYETKNDIMKIDEMVRNIRKFLDQNKKFKIYIKVCINCHIKKPHTVFERDAQMSPDIYFGHIEKLKKRMGDISNCSINCMNRDLLALESLLVRGSKNDGDILYELFQDNGTKITEQKIKEKLKKKYLNYFKPKKGKLPWKIINLSLPGGLLNQQNKKIQKEVKKWK